MSIALNYTTIDPAETKSNWETVSSGSSIDDSSYPSKQGNECIQFEVSPNSLGGIRNKTAVTAFSVRENEVGLWFLNPVVDNNGDKVIASTQDGLFLRLYSSSGNYADYYQPQHRNINGDWNGGWMYLRASGGAGDEDSNSGTWTNSDADSITKVAVMVNSGAGDTTDKNSGKFGVDWAKYYDKIIVTGDTNGNPYTLNDIYAADQDKSIGGGVWGVVDKAEGFYSFYCGIDFGDGSAGSFSTENEYIYLAQLNNTQKFHIDVKANFTLSVGKKEILTQTYMKNGINITANGYPDFNIANSATLYMYDTKVQGFNNINLGQGSGTTIEILKSDLYNNNALYLNGNGITFKDNRTYFDSSNKGNVGQILKTPTEFKNISIFNAENGFEVYIDTTLIEYKANNNTTDILIKDAKTVTLLDSVFTSLKRIS